MRIRPVTHLTDSVLVSELKVLTAKDRGTIAQLLVHLGEVDARKLYLPAGHSSMHSYCVDELLMSEDTAYKRIRVAREARQYAVIIEAIADGRLNLNGVMLLAPYLTPENAKDLLTAAFRRRRSGLELLIAQRFPRPDLPTWIEPTSQKHSTQLAARPVEVVGVAPPGREGAITVAEPAPIPMEHPAPRPNVVPLAPQRFGIQFTVGQETLDLLQRAQELLGHQIPPGDVAQVFHRGLKLLVQRLEKQKFAATEQPCTKQSRPSRNPRHIPAAVKRAVRKRDGDRCTFLSDSGHRCESRTQLEFDHVDPIARGGAATVGNIRLRCRAHNQFEAERAFGAGFMNGKRETARESRVRAAAEARRFVEGITQAAP